MVTVQVVKTGITPQCGPSVRFWEAETEPLRPAGRLHMIEFHIIREIFRLSNPELLAVWRSPAWSADTKSPHSPPHFETSRYRAVCAASPYESARVDSSCGSRSPATRESPPSGTRRSCQNR